MKERKNKMNTTKNNGRDGRFMPRHAVFRHGINAKWLLAVLCVFAIVLILPSAQAAPVSFDDAVAYTPDNRISAIAPETPNAAFPSALMDLDAEVIKDLAASTVHYIYANDKWTKVTSSADGTISIAAYLSKAQTFSVALAEGSSMDETTAITFPPTAARPIAIAKATVNYEIFKDDTGQTAGGWTIAEKGSSIGLGDNGATLLVLPSTDVKSVKDGTPKEGISWRTFPSTGMTVAAPKAAKATYVIRSAPSYLDGVYTPASAVKAFKPVSQSAAPTIKIDYKKEILKLKKNFVAIVGQQINDEMTNLVAFDKSGVEITSVLDAASITATKNEVTAAVAFWQQATDKKPASAVAYFGTAAAAAKLFPGNSLPVNSKMLALLPRGTAISAYEFKFKTSKTSGKWTVPKNVMSKTDIGAAWVKLKTPANGIFVRRAATKSNSAGVMSILMLDTDTKDISVFQYKQNDIVFKTSLTDTGKHVSVIDTPKWDAATNTQSVYVTYLGIPDDELPSVGDPNIDQILPLPQVSFENAVGYASASSLDLTFVRDDTRPNVFKLDLPALIPQTAPVKMTISMEANWSYTYTSADGEKVYSPSLSVPAQDVTLVVPPINFKLGGVTYGKDKVGNIATTNSNFAPMTIYSGVDYNINLTGDEHPCYEGNVVTVLIDGLVASGTSLLSASPNANSISLSINNNSLKGVAGDPWTIAVDGDSFKVTFKNDQPYAKNKFTFSIVVGSNLSSIYKSGISSMDVYVQSYGTDSLLANDKVNINTTAFALSDASGETIIPANTPVDSGAQISLSSQVFDVVANGGGYARYTEADGATALSQMPGHTGSVVVKSTDTDSFVINERIAKLLIDAASQRKSVYYQILSEEMTLRDLPTTVDGFKTDANWKGMSQSKGLFSLLNSQVNIIYGDIIYIAVVSEYGEQATVYSFDVKSEQTSAKPNDATAYNYAVKENSTTQYPMTLGTGAATVGAITTGELGYLPIAADAGASTVSDIIVTVTAYDPNSTVSISKDGTNYTNMTSNMLDARVKTATLSSLTVTAADGSGSDYVYIKFKSSGGSVEHNYKLVIVTDKFTMKDLSVGVSDTAKQAATTPAPAFADIDVLKSFDPANDPSRFGVIKMAAGSYKKGQPLKLFLDGVFHGKTIIVNENTPVAALAVQYAINANPFTNYQSFSGIKVDTDNVLYLQIGDVATGTAMYYAYTFVSDDTSIGNDAYGNQSLLGAYPVVRDKGSDKFAATAGFAAPGAIIGEINIGTNTDVRNVKFDAKTTDPRAKVMCSVTNNLSSVPTFGSDNMSVSVKSGEYLCVEVTASDKSTTSYYAYKVVNDVTSLDLVRTIITGTDVDKGTIDADLDNAASTAYTAYRNAVKASEDGDIALAAANSELNSLMVSYKLAEKTKISKAKDLTYANSEFTKCDDKVKALVAKASETSFVDSNSYQISLAKARTALNAATEKKNLETALSGEATAAFDYFDTAIYGVGGAGGGAEDAAAAAKAAIATLKSDVTSAKSDYENALLSVSAQPSFKDAKATALKGTITIKDTFGATVSVDDTDIIKTDPGAAVALNVSGNDVGADWGASQIAIAGRPLFVRVTSTSGIVRYYTFDVFTNDGGLSSTTGDNKFNGRDADPIMIAKNTFPLAYGEIDVQNDADAAGKVTGILTLKPNTVKSTIKYLVFDKTTLPATIGDLETAFGSAAAKTVSTPNGTEQLDATVTLTVGEYLIIQSTPPQNLSAIPAPAATAYYYGYIVKSSLATFIENANGNIGNYATIDAGITKHEITSFGTGETTLADAKLLNNSNCGRLVLKNTLSLTGASINLTPADAGASVDVSLDGVLWTGSGTVNLDVQTNNYLYVAITSSNTLNTQYYKLLVSSSETALYISDGAGSTLGESNLTLTGDQYEVMFTETGDNEYDVPGTKTLDLVFGSSSYKDSGATYSIKNFEAKAYSGRTSSQKPSNTGLVISNLWYGDKIVVTVTASDGKTEKDYTILVVNSSSGDERNTSADRAILKSDAASHNTGTGYTVLSVGTPGNTFNGSTVAGKISVSPGGIDAKFKAVDKNAVIRYSLDGTNWVKDTSAAPALAIDISSSAANVLYVEVTSSGATKPDGIGTTINYYKFDVVSNVTELALTGGITGGSHPDYEAEMTPDADNKVNDTTITLSSLDTSTQTYVVKSVSPAPQGGRGKILTANVAGDTLTLTDVYIGDKIVITVTAADGMTKQDITITITAA